MPVPPPPPPPPPPPSLSSNSPPTLTTQKATGARAMLLSEIHKGTRLKKTVTNDRSGPAVEGKIVGEETVNKSCAGRTAAASTANQKPLAPKPGGAMGLGDLFKDGVPRKPSDLKNQKSAVNQAVTSNTLSRNESGPQKPKDSPVKKTPLALASAGNGTAIGSHSAAPSSTGTTANKSTRAAAISNLQKSISTTTVAPTAPPPLPAKLPKQKPTIAPQQPSKLPLSQHGQFQTLRPSKTQPNSNENRAPLRRAGSTEEIQKRPSLPPPPPIMRRPGGPPPPPPPLTPRPVAQLAPTAVKKAEQPPTSNGKSSTTPPRVEAPPPPLPPPRVSSYLESMEQRFHFVPISELPPPPKFIGFRKEYDHLQVSK